MEDVKKPQNNNLQFYFSKLIPLLLVCLITLLFFTSINLLFVRWIKWDESLSHGLMVIGLFLFLIFKSSPWPVIPQSRWLTFCCASALGLASIFWFLAHISSIFILEQLALIPVLILLVATILGWKTSRQHAILIAMPMFAIPVWDNFTDPLVNLSGLMVGKLVQLINMPAVIDGNSIFIPYGHILIADGCSGIRYFVIALALGYIISYLNNYRLSKFLITLSIAAILGLIANWIRIFALVVIGYQTEMQSSLMNDHEYFGWFLFALIGFPAIYFAPVIKTNNHTAISSVTPKVSTWILALGALCLGPILNLAFNPAPQAQDLSDLLEHNLAPIPSTSMLMPITNPVPAHHESATDGKIYFQIDQYQRQTAQDKLVPYIGRLYNNELWSKLHSKIIKDKNLSAELAWFRHKSSGRTLVQIQWMRIANANTHSVSAAKLLQIVAQLRAQNHFAIISLQAACADDECDRSEEDLINAAKSLTIKN